MSRSEEKKSKYHFDISEQLKRQTKSSRAESPADHVTKTSLKISSQVENAKDETGIIPPPVWPQIIIDRNRDNYVTSIQVSTEVPSPTTTPSQLSYLTLESEKDTRQPDSIVTQSLLMLMTGSESESKSVKSEENTSTKLVIKNKHPQSLSGALSSARRSFRGVKGTIRSSSRKIIRRKPGRNKTGSLRSAGSVEAVRELWSKTGMRTNGRKLLLGARDTEASSWPQEEVNGGYESDNSQVSVPRERLTRTFPGQATTRRQTSSSSSASSVEEGGGRPRPSRLLRKVERKLSDPDRIERLEKTREDIREENNPAKHVRFHHPRYLREQPPPRQQPRPVNNLLWDKYYGATEAGLRMVNSSSTLGSDFTMDQARNKNLLMVDKRRRKMKCCCKISCFVLLLVSFLLVIITVTYLLTKGKRYFGAL